MDNPISSYRELEVLVRQNRTPGGADFILSKLIDMRAGLQKISGAIFLVREHESPFWEECFLFRDQDDYFVSFDWLRGAYPIGQERCNLLESANLKIDDDQNIGVRIAALSADLDKKFEEQSQETENLAEYTGDEITILKDKLAEDRDKLLDDIRTLETEWMEYPFYNCKDEIGNIRSTHQGLKVRVTSLSDKIASISLKTSFIDSLREMQKNDEAKKARSERPARTRELRPEVQTARSLLGVINQPEIKSGISAHFNQMGKISPGQKWVVAIADSILDSATCHERFIPLFQLIYPEQGEPSLVDFSTNLIRPISLRHPGRANSLKDDIQVSDLSLPDFFKRARYILNLGDFQPATGKEIRSQFRFGGFDFGVNGTIIEAASGYRILQTDNIKMTVVNHEYLFVGMRFYDGEDEDKTFRPFEEDHLLSYTAFPTGEIPTLDPADMFSNTMWGKGHLIFNRNGNGNLFIPLGNWDDLRGDYNGLVGFFRDGVEASKLQSVTKYRAAVQAWHRRLLNYFAIESFNIK